jgi:hypothetical protein
LCLDHDDFGLNQSKIIVIDSNSSERDAEKRLLLCLNPLAENDAPAILQAHR